MIDKILAILSLAVLVSFLGVIVWFVPEPDLAVVVGVVLVMAFYDFYRTAFRNNNDSD